MEFAADIVQAAHRLGVDLRWESPHVRVQRRGWSVVLDAKELMVPSAFREQRIDAAWLLLGVRLGLDKRAGDESDAKELSALHFRRTSLRRYQEAPSVHGDRLLFMVPTLTRQTFEEIAKEEASFRPWILPSTDILLLYEKGKRLDILTADEAIESDTPEDKIWEKARAALFYDSYKVRPRQEIDIEGGTLRIFESSEGLMASRALLLPEFDYDASQDGGLAATPTRDSLIVARSKEAGQAEVMLPGLLQEIKKMQSNSEFWFTDAIFGLSSDEISLQREPSIIISSASAGPISERIIAVEPVLQSFDGA